MICNPTLLNIRIYNLQINETWFDGRSFFLGIKKSVRYLQLTINHFSIIFARICILVRLYMQNKDATAFCGRKNK